MHDRAAVVVRVREGRQRQHEPVQLGRAHAHGDAGPVGAEPHQARGDVAVEVDGRRFGGCEGADLPDHGEDDGFGAGWVGHEGDVQDGGGVDDVVDEVGVVFGWGGGDDQLVNVK